MKKEKEFSFETSLNELQNKVHLLEKGDLPLEEALKNYEEGVKFARNCQEMLKKAEQKITQLKKIES